MRRFERGNCSCGRKNVIMFPGEHGGFLCNDCTMTNVRLELQEIIKESGLKSAQIEWERAKPQFEQVLNLYKQNGDCRCLGWFYL